MKSPLAILLEQPGGRRAFALSVLSALARAVGIVLIAEAVVRSIVGSTPLATWAVLGILGAVLRGASLWADHSLGTSVAAGNKQRLRGKILSGLLGRPGQPKMNTAVTVTRSIDDLDDYFTTVVPALSAAAVVPVTLLVRIVFTDILSAVIIVLCLPLVPVFMILIGRYTEESTAAGTTALERLSDHLAELAEGLPVLIGLGRSKDHARGLRTLSDDYHRANLSTLRIAFLSSLALELIATISVALVAVVIGLRLVSGTMDLSSGLFVLLLAPECFIPLRQLGAGFHASENGREAQDRANALIEGTRTGMMGIETQTFPSTDAATPLGSDPAQAGPTGDAHCVVYANGTAIAWSGEVDTSPGITAVRGASGAGKSTVLAAVVGSLPDTATTTLTPARAAFVPQTPRMFAATLGGELDLYGVSPEQQRRALEEASLPLDLKTPTAALSPGQLRRLSFVRILHRFDSAAEVLVLDEPTAHLDDENAEIIIAMIAEAARRIRVILASHDPRVLDLADAQIVPSKTQTVPLKTENVLSKADAVTDVQVDVQSDSPSSPTHPGSTEADSLAALGDDSSGADETLGRRSLLRRRWSRLRTSLPLFNADMILALCASCASSLAAIALTAVSAWLIVEASYQPPIMILLVAIVGVRFFGLSRSVLLYASRLKLHSAIFGSLGSLRSRLWEHFENVGMSDRKMLTSDTALRAMVSDADDVRDLVPRTLFPPIASGMVMVAIIVATWILDPGSVPIMVVLGVLNLGVLPFLVIGRENDLAHRIRVERSRILSLLTRALNAKTDLRTNGALGGVLRLASGVEKRLETAEASSSRNFGIASLWIQLSTVVAALLIAVTSAAPTEILAVIVLMALGLADIFASALSAFRQLPALGVVLDRLPETAPPDGSTDETGLSTRREDLGTLAELELDQVTVGWDEQPVLDGLDLRADNDRWTLICGESGSGKSTTLSVLLRFLTPWSGSYRATDAGGADIDMLERGPAEVAGRIAWCPQEAHIFRSTVRGNLAIARSDTPTAEEMSEALTSAGLEEWANPAGLDLWVGDHGSEISGGQRQRLAVARTLLSGAEVIILDEPTAHLDEEMAARLMGDLRTNLSSHTVVMVTHDRSLIAAGDRVIDLERRVSPASIRT